MAQELDGLKLAAELQFQNVADGKLVARGKSQRLQELRCAGWDRKARNGARSGPALAAEPSARRWRITGAQHRGRQTFSVAHVAAEGQMAVGEDGALQGKAGAHVRSAAIAIGGRSGEERKRAASTRGPASRRRKRGIVKDAQNGAVRDRTQSPLPVVVIGNSANGAKLHHAQQRAQSDIDIEAGAGREDRLSRARRAGMKGP